MSPLASVSDSELLARVPLLIQRERAASVDVIEHLVELDRRRLYLEQACSSLYSFCIERMGYSENEALKRARVARLAGRLPQVLDELRSGALHLTALFLLAPHLTEQNADGLLSDARGKSRRVLEELLARRYPKPDVEARVERIAEQGTLAGVGTASGERSGPANAFTCPGNAGTERGAQGKLEPLSASRYLIQFTASAELRAKLQKAQELLSHALPSGDLSALFERAVDALIEREVRRRRGAGGQRKRRVQKPGSRHVPLDVVAEVWRRDAEQCSFVDSEGRRCSERRFLTLEHKQPYALGGAATVENLCLLCASHNAHTARQVFGDAYIENKRHERVQTAAPESAAPLKSPVEREQPEAQVCAALCSMGFPKQQASKALAQVRARQVPAEPEQLLRASLALLVPDAWTAS
jgi:5-methylcytosine-specific restriction endonuclease McrA